MFSFDEATMIWIGLAILAAIVEIMIPHFGVIFVSAGAFVAALGASLGLSSTPQVLLFVAAAAASMLLLRPRLVARLGGQGVPSRTAALIGREAIVTHDIEALAGTGRVNVGGEDWAARANAPLQVGTRVRVVAADGIVLEVTPL